MKSSVIKVSLIMVMILLATACTTDKDDDLVNIVFSESGASETIDSGDKYTLSIMGDGNIITVKGDLAAITITGEGNWLIIEEDNYIEKLTLTGDGNIVGQSENLSVTIQSITITSDSNTVTVSEYIELDDVGEDNQVSETQSGDMRDL